MFRPGDEVTITMIGANNGEPIGHIARITVKGKTFEGMGQVPGEAAKQE
jgi:hypothetical protein